MSNKPLSELAQISGGWTTSAAEEGAVRLVRTSDIPTGEVAWAEVPYAEKEPSNVEHYLRDGDIVIARTGVGSVGNVAIIRNPPLAVAASYLLRVRVARDVNVEYVAWYLRTPAGRAQLAERAVGSVVPNLSSQRLATVTIPLPTLTEQDTIADRIVNAKAHLDKAFKALKQAQELLKRAPSGIWRDLVNASQARGEVWAQKELDEMISVHDRQRVALNKDERVRRPGTTPYFGASGVIDYIGGHTHEGDFLLLSEDGQNLESRRQNIAFQAEGRFWANNHVHVLSVHESVNAAFLAQALNVIDLQSYLTGSTQPKLPLNRLRRIHVTIPDRDSQDTIMESFQTMASSIAEAEVAVDSAHQKLASGWNAFLANCFPGASPSPVAPPPVTEIAKDDMKERDVPAQKRFDSLLSALDQYPNGLTPEELYKSIRWETSTAGDDVDAFYSELRRLVENGDVQDTRVAGVALLRRLS